jgi:hypothetical protein
MQPNRKIRAVFRLLQSIFSSRHIHHQCGASHDTVLVSLHDSVGDFSIEAEIVSESARNSPGTNGTRLT